MTLIGRDGQAVTDQDAPKIEFPCENYPVKVVGVRCEDYRGCVLEIFELHAPGFDVEKIRVRDSSNGRFQALTVYITATGIEQLKRLHQDLQSHKLVHMVM